MLLNCAPKRSRQERLKTGTVLFRPRAFVQGEHKISWGDNWSNRKVSKFAIVCSCRIPKIRLPSFLNFKKTSKMQKCKNALFPKCRRLWISFDPARSLLPRRTLQIVCSSLVVFLYWLVLPSFPTSWPDAPSSRSLTLSASVHSPSRQGGWQRQTNGRWYSKNSSSSSSSSSSSFSLSE